MKSLLSLLLVAGCATNDPPEPPPPAPAYGIIVENQTAEQLTVFGIERNVNTRLGFVEPRKTALVPVAEYYLPRSRALRVYLFRGPEPCPVARVVDFRVSTRPRVTVSAVDTAVAGYLSTDACRVRGN